MKVYFKKEELENRKVYMEDCINDAIEDNAVKSVNFFRRVVLIINMICDNDYVFNFGDNTIESVKRYLDYYFFEDYEIENYIEEENKCYVSIL